MHIGSGLHIISGAVRHNFVATLRSAFSAMKFPRFSVKFSDLGKTRRRHGIGDVNSFAVAGLLYQEDTSAATIGLALGLVDY